MAAALLKVRGKVDVISCIVVGADRVARNGDTANKIGTYNLAILAKFHGIKFLVAAPRTTIDLDTAGESSIQIEQRREEEVTNLKGPEVQHAEDDSVSYGAAKEIRVAAAGSQAWNPSFDVTGAELIDGIITEKGVIEKGTDGRFHFDSIFDDKDREHESDGHEDGSSQLASGRGALISWEKAINMRAGQVKPWTSWMELLD